MRDFPKAQRDFQRALEKDRRGRVQTTGSNIEVSLTDERVKEAWDHLARWYFHAWGKQAYFTREVLDLE